jgi:type IV secretory pathway TrbL component
MITLPFRSASFRDTTWFFSGLIYKVWFLALFAWILGEFR